MKTPEFVSKEAVSLACKELEIRDWTTLETDEVTLDEANTILAALDTGELTVDSYEFKRGLEVELEHGLRFKNANVTNNHPILTGMIVLAHFEESPDYYRRLEVMELEGDFHQAMLDKDYKRADIKYEKLIKEKAKLYSAL